MSKMKDSGVAWIGQIPEDWDIKPIRHFLTERIEKNQELKIKTILSLSAKEGVSLYNGENHSGNKPRENLSDYKIVKQGDIVANSMNILSGSVGLSEYTGVVSPVYYIYYPRKNDNIEYLHYIFQCKEFQRSLFGLGNGILIKESENGNLNTIRMRIPAKKLSIQSFPCCSRKKQDCIVKNLDSSAKKIDTLIANQEQQIEKLKAYKQSLITETVTKGLNTDSPMKDSGIEWIGQIPEHWEIKRMKFIADSFNKGNGITKEDVVVDGNTPCVRYGEIYTKYNYNFDCCYTHTNKETLSVLQYFTCGDILFTATGELVEKIGKSIAYLGKEQCLAGGDVIIMKHSQIPKFLGFALDSLYARMQKGYGKTKLKVVHTSVSNLGNVYIAIPPLSEQKQIADYLDEKCAKIDALIEIKQQKIVKLTNYKKSLIYEYVTGKKEVTI